MEAATEATEQATDQPRRRVEREVELDLTPEDKANYADRLGVLTAEADHFSIEQARLKENYLEEKAKVDGDFNKREAEVKEIRSILRNRRHKQKVICDEVRNFEGNAIEYWLDGKKVHERAMSADERQEEIDFGDEPAAAEESAPVADDWLAAANAGDETEEAEAELAEALAEEETDGEEPPAA